MKKNSIQIMPSENLLDIAGKFTKKIKGKSILKARKKLESKYKRV